MSDLVSRNDFKEPEILVFRGISVNHCRHINSGAFSSGQLALKPADIFFGELLRRLNFYRMTGKSEAIHLYDLAYSGQLYGGGKRIQDFLRIRRFEFKISNGGFFAFTGSLNPFRLPLHHLFKGDSFQNFRCNSQEFRSGSS